MRTKTVRTALNLAIEMGKITQEQANVLLSFMSISFIEERHEKGSTADHFFRDLLKVFETYGATIYPNGNHIDGDLTIEWDNQNEHLSLLNHGNPDYYKIDVDFVKSLPKRYKAHKKLCRELKNADSDTAIKLLMEKHEKDINF